jgi:hypothetical protein
MRKILTYLGCLVSAALVIWLFVTAKTYIQLAIGVVLYPLFAYLTLQLFPRRAQVAQAAPQAVQAPTYLPSAIPIQEKLDREKVKIVDIDRRTFLKLLGTAGISFFIFSLFGRRVEELIFNRSANINTQVPSTDESQSQIADTDVLASEGFKISEIDDSDLISYYGFTNKQGGWLIMRQDSENNSFRYSKGTENFSKNWNERQELKYDYYYKLF